MKKLKNRIIFVAQNPGGFNAISPVIKKIKDRVKVLTLLSADAKAIAKKEKIKFIDTDKKNDEQLKGYLEKFAPRAVVTGTSQGMSLDKKIIDWAKDKEIPTVSIIDFWANYRIRFSSPETADLAYLPDYICVIDEYMKKQMVNEGFKNGQLFITGNPYFDTFGNYSKIKGKFIVFAEQPLSELYAKSQKTDKASKIDEVKVFADFVAALEKQKTKYPILIVLHPRCKKISKFDNIIAGSILKIKIFKGNPENLWREAELILGINSVVLFQSALEGKKVLSYQPGLTEKEDPLMSNRLRLSEAAYSRQEMERKIRIILSAGGPKTKRQAAIKKYVNNSTQKVIDLINKILLNSKNMKKNVVCIVQARVGSTRLPGKIFLELKGKSVLGQDIERLKQAKLINKIVIACPDSKENDVIEKYVKENYPDIGIWRGSENDVLDRYYGAAKKYKADVAIRITSDCPLIVPEVVDRVIQAFLDRNDDYVSNVLGRRTYPRGLDTEVFSFAALERMWREGKEPDDREHVTIYLRKNPAKFSASNVEGDKDYSQYRLTLDVQKDYDLINAIYEALDEKEVLKLESIIKFLEKNPELAKINQEVEQKHGKF
jgi:spore coat polysaccharide biosynthesis protein SpsF (cytidylyltransferase family)